MLSVIRNGRTYEVPLEIEARGDQAVEAWLVSAEAQEDRAAAGEPGSAPAPKRVKRGSPGAED